MLLKPIVWRVVELMMRRVSVVGLCLVIGIFPGVTVAHPVGAPLQVEFPLVMEFESFYVDNDDDDYLADGGEILLGELN